MTIRKLIRTNYIYNDESKQIDEVYSFITGDDTDGMVLLTNPLYDVLIEDVPIDVNIIADIQGIRVECADSCKHAPFMTSVCETVYNDNIMPFDVNDQSNIDHYAKALKADIEESIVLYGIQKFKMYTIALHSENKSYLINLRDEEYMCKQYSVDLEPNEKTIESFNAEPIKSDAKSGKEFLDEILNKDESKFDVEKTKSDLLDTELLEELIAPNMSLSERMAMSYRNDALAITNDLTKSAEVDENRKMILLQLYLDNASKLMAELNIARVDVDCSNKITAICELDSVEDDVES